MSARALNLLGLDAVGGEKPKNLSLGQQKLLGVARALAARPHVVLLDEPAAGLDSTESRALGDRLYDIVGVLGWNDSPVERGRGSAIFLHVARPDYAPTEGCIALALADFGFFFPNG